MLSISTRSGNVQRLLETPIAPVEMNISVVDGNTLSAGVANAATLGVKRLRLSRHYDPRTGVRHRLNITEDFFRQGRFPLLGELSVSSVDGNGFLHILSSLEGKDLRRVEIRMVGTADEGLRALAGRKGLANLEQLRLHRDFLDGDAPVANPESILSLLGNANLPALREIRVDYSVAQSVRLYLEGNKNSPRLKGISMDGATIRYTAPRTE